MLKVALIGSSDLAGGASRAMYRLHRGLLDIGVDSRVLVQAKLTSDPDVYGLGSAGAKAWAQVAAYLDRLPVRRYPNRKPGRFSPAWVPDVLRDRIARLSPDLVHLHWVGDGMMRIETLRGLQLSLIHI